jgi:hypothetical protein
MKIIKAPSPLDISGKSVFLAGSIEMGAAENWQERVERTLRDYPVTILNPRRDDWDGSWVQDIKNPRFREQVEWELDALEQSSVIAMYFDPSTKSPISLLELGLFAQSGKLFVCCPDGFWRKGNVQIVCRRYRVPLYQTLDDLIYWVSLDLQL